MRGPTLSAVLHRRPNQFNEPGDDSEDQPYYVQPVHVQPVVKSSADQPTNDRCRRKQKTQLRIVPHL